MAVLAASAAFFVMGDGVENGVANNEGVTVPATAPRLVGSDKLILTVDQYGNLSSTNAIATSADLAAISASNQLVAAVQRANEDGYRTATNLINEVASAVVSTPIIFCSAEISSFVAATVFDEATAQLRVFKWQVDDVVQTNSIVVNGVSTPVECKRITCGYMFTSDISSLSPKFKYVEHLDRDYYDRGEWDFLNDALVEAPVAVEHEQYVDAAGTTFSNFYEVHLWIPTDRMSGFFRVVVENEPLSAEGNTIDTVGVKGGYTGVVTNGTMVLNIRGGYIMAAGTGQLTAGE